MTGSANHVDLIVTARWVVPIEPFDVYFRDTGVAVKDGRVVALLPIDELTAKYTATETVRLSDNHVLLPGFVNAHTHMGMQHMRGMAEDMPLIDWLNKLVWPAEAKFVSYEFVHDGVELAVAEMLRSGTTCFSDMYFFPEAAVDVLEKTKMRGVVSVPLIEFPTNYTTGFDDGIAKARALHAATKDKPLIKTAIAPHAPYTVTEAHLVEAWKLAEELDVPYHIHLHETADEVTHSKEGVQSNARHLSSELLSPIENFKRLGIVGPRLVAAHVVHTSDDEIKILGDSKSNIVHCPYSNLKLASGFCQVHSMLGAGVNVGLGTDSAASNNELSMLAEAKIAASLGKAVAKSAAAMPGSTVLRMATINGARALGLDHEIGSLKPGKAADMIAVDLGGVEHVSVFNPIIHLIYSTNRNQVTDTWVAGRRMLRDRKLTTIDESELHNRAVKWFNQIHSTHYIQHVQSPQL